ncbi:tetratricopeptide repeat protein [Catenuloplanes atrovinosus]|uniref:Tetratricopeptide (TPR) repeat protein n=1 Tax=Catenuloplanes atrovinosus TaxID=137266 RepID=A0AAE3YS77_9ACTN|nr:hypothetical protein [Catenuloplanes atrovinosus]MDR7277690.1 tetratricopeptide (TPR) repeat protein [Catenuloplanes atrovinosus]
MPSLPLRKQYRALPAPVRGCCDAFTVQPGHDVSVPALAATLGTTDTDVDAHVRHLTGTGLVRPEPGGRYRMPPLFWARAAKELQRRPGRRQLLTERFGDWCLGHARAAAAIVAPYRTPYPAKIAHLDPAAIAFPTPAAALDWLANERVTLLALAHDRKDTDPHLVWLLVDALRVLFDVRGGLDDRITADGIALDCAVRAGDPVWLSHAWRRTGWSQYDWGHHAAADDAFQQAIQSATGIDDTRTRIIATASATEGLATIYAAEGDIDQALRLLDAHQGVFTAHGDNRSQGLSALTTAVILINAQRPRDALPVLSIASDMLIRAGGTDPYHATRVGLETGRALTALGDHDAAKFILAMALQQMVTLGLPRGHATAARYLGDLAMRLGCLPEARAYYETAADLYAHLGDHTHTVITDLLNRIDNLQTRRGPRATTAVRTAAGARRP